MEYTREEMLVRARTLGYELHHHSSDKTYYSFIHERYPINLQLYTETNEFQLVHVHGMLTTSTGKCGSFMSEIHFLKFQRWMIDAVLKLHG